MKNYRFENGRYEFCQNKTCDLQSQLVNGDKAHHLCCDCIAEYDGIKPNLNELSSTSRIRRNRSRQ